MDMERKIQWPHKISLVLTSHNLGLGGIWWGEIRKNRESFEKILDVSETFELMAVVAPGHPTEPKRQSNRKLVDHAVTGRE